MKRPSGEGIIILESSLWPPVPLMRSPLQCDRRPKRRSQPQPGGAKRTLLLSKSNFERDDGDEGPGGGGLQELMYK